MTSILSMREPEFTPLFLKTMKELAKADSTTTQKSFYRIYTYMNQTNWFGVNLTKLVFTASNPADLWLQFRDYMVNHSTFDFYNYDLIRECIIEEHEDGNKIVSSNMHEAVKYILDLFDSDDTIWYDELKMV